MKFKVLGCYGSCEAGFRLTSFLINDTVLLDAGDTVSSLTFDEQTKIRKIIISHAHLDHINSLPFLALNFHDADNYPVEIFSPAPVIKIIKDHIMNNIIWPDFSRIPSSEKPVFRFIELEERKEINIGELYITPIPVDHIIPTFGYVIKDKNSSMIYSSDTWDLGEILESAEKLDNLEAVIIEVTFSSKENKLARESKHLTPSSLGKQLEKFNSKAGVYLFHMKANHLQTIRDECKGLNLDVELLEQGRTYFFE